MEKKLVDKGTLVVKGNSLIEASYALSLQEQRIVLYMASQIQPYDEEFKPVRIRISYLMELVGVTNRKQYKELLEITKKLRRRDLIIKQNDSSILQTGWVSSARYIYKKGIVELRFDPNLKPHLLLLKERFTKYYFNMVIHMRHSYSIRFYELLKQYQPIGTRYFDLDEFKYILGIEPERYKYFNDLRRRVIEPIRDEFDEKFFEKHELDLTFDYHPKKEGRKVVGIHLDIIDTLPEKLLESQADVPKETTSVDELLSELLEMKVSKRQANSLIKKYAPDVIKRNIELTKKRADGGTIANTQGYLIEAIKNDYAKDSNSVTSESPKLRSEAMNCLNRNKGCSSKWSTHKNNKSIACHYCPRFDNRRK